MQTTYRDILTFLHAAQPWLASQKAESKLKYAVTKVTKQCNTLLARYNEEGEDLDIEHCAVDEKGIILKDERGGLQFTKEGLAKRNAARRALFVSPVEIQPFLVATPDDLPPALHEAFAGFVVAGPELVEA